MFFILPICRLNKLPTRERLLGVYSSLLDSVSPFLLNSVGFCFLFLLPNWILFRLLCWIQFPLMDPCFTFLIGFLFTFFIGFLVHLLHRISYSPSLSDSVSPSCTSLLCNHSAKSISSGLASEVWQFSSLSERGRSKA